MAHRCGATGRDMSALGYPTAPASHDRLRKTELLLLAEGLYPSLITYLLTTRTIFCWSGQNLLESVETALSCVQVRKVKVRAEVRRKKIEVIRK